MGSPDMVDQFGQRHVAVLRQEHKLIGGRFKAMGAMVAAPCARSNAARASLLLDPFDRRRRRNAEKLRRRSARHPALDSRCQPFAQSHRKRFRHAGSPPSPARILNQIIDRLGIPNDSIRLKIALANRPLNKLDAERTAGAPAIYSTDSHTEDDARLKSGQRIRGEARNGRRLSLNSRRRRTTSFCLRPPIAAFKAQTSKPNSRPGTSGFYITGLHTDCCCQYMSGDALQRGCDPV
jgi:hypothetical protein